MKKQKNKYYDLGSRCVNSILASMRMKCSQLNSNIYLEITLFKIDYALVVLKRQFFIIVLSHRDSLLMETLSITTLAVEKVLHGDKDVNINDNIKLHNAVSKYIIATKKI